MQPFVAAAGKTSWILEQNKKFLTSSIVIIYFFELYNKNDLTTTPEKLSNNEILELFVNCEVKKKSVEDSCFYFLKIAVAYVQLFLSNCSVHF